MTCRGLLKHVAAYYPTWDHPYADRLSLAFGLRLDRNVATLSKGESRRLQLVLALAHRPPVLLLDEPTDGLDPVVRSRTLSLLAEHLADTPTTILISTHHIHELESLADHVGVCGTGGSSRRCLATSCSALSGGTTSRSPWDGRRRKSFRSPAYAPTVVVRPSGRS